MRTLLLPLLFALAPLPALSQPICYYQDTRGKITDLTPMCSRKVAEIATSNDTTGKPLSDRQISGIVLKYAQEYCDNRAEGQAPRRADRAATKVAVEFAFNLAGGVPANDDQLISALAGTPAQQAIRQECPEYAPR